VFRFLGNRNEDGSEEISLILLGRKYFAARNVEKNAVAARAKWNEQKPAEKPVCKL
jgi:hypothetical protein